ncbi:MAG: PAS domain-containing protein, partial [Alphaproteobacteria bacterium]
MQKPPEQIIEDKRLLALYGYWESKRGDRAIPARGDIDPLEIPELLPLILLIDVLQTGEYQYRLMGTEIVNNFGNNVTGLTFTEALPDGPYLEYITGLVRDVVSTGRPLYSEGAFMAKGRANRQVRRLVLPLSDDGHTIDKLLGGQVTIDTNKGT